MAARIRPGDLKSASDPTPGRIAEAFARDVGPDVAPHRTGIPFDAHGGRVGALRELPTVLRMLGFEPDGIIGRCGLDTCALDVADNALPASSARGLLDACAEATGCGHVGLLVGARSRPPCFGVVGLLMQHLPTVSESLLCLIGHGHPYQFGAVSTLEIRDGTAILRHWLTPADVQGGRQVLDCALASCCRMMQALCGPDWTPHEVLLSHPSDNEESPYGRTFGSPVRFDQEGTALVFDARWLSHPVAGADTGFRHMLEVQVNALERLHDESLSSQLRRALRTLLLRKGCSAGRTAQLFALHPRTMSRRLKAEGQSYQHLVDEVRYDIARYLLANAALSLAEVAVALGYSEASAFTRAFRRWSGINPKAWRLGGSAGLDLAEPKAGAALPLA